MKKKVMAGWAAFMRSENNQADVSDEAWMHLPEKVRAGWWSAIRAVTQKDAQPEQPAAQGEPVAWLPSLDYPQYEKQRVWANGKPRQEDIDYWEKHGNGITYAYTHPQQASEPMTDEHGIELAKQLGWRVDFDEIGKDALELIRAVERFHKIGGE